jgi:hypothetical protein
VLVLCVAIGAWAAHQAASAGGSAPAPKHGPGGYRFARPPLAVVTREGPGLPSFDVYFRVNRPLPTGRDPDYARLDGLRAPDGIPGFVPGSRTCARAELNATRRHRLRFAKAGDRVTFRVHLSGVTRDLVARVRLMKPLPAERGPNGLLEPDRPYARRLGC